jgi:hypothetical protein
MELVEFTDGSVCYMAFNATAQCLKLVLPGKTKTKRSEAEIQAGSGVHVVSKCFLCGSVYLIGCDLKERDRSEDLSVDGRILECILEKYGGKVWTGCIWLSIGNSGGLL